MTDLGYYDSIADEQKLLAWPIQLEGTAPSKVVERSKDAVVGAFIKLREEGFAEPFTVFMGDHPGVDVFIAIQGPTFRMLPVRTWLEKFLAAIQPLVPGPQWRNLNSPSDGIATPLFRYTPSRIKDYRIESDEQIGQSSQRNGMEMTFFGVVPTLGSQEEYDDN